MKYFVVGAGIWGSVMARQIAEQLNAPVTVIEKRDHSGGNCHSSLDAQTGIECHRYGSHIFHTSLPSVAEWISRFCEFTSYRHKVLTRHSGHVYSMPINLSTINDFYVRDFSPAEAQEFLQAEIARDKIDAPANLEEKTISLIGRPLYEAFIKNYTRKQWNSDPRDLPAEIISRLPFRNNYNFDYFNDPVQGVPRDGYFQLFKNMLDHPNITLELNTDYKTLQDKLPTDAMIIHTGMPDELFDYRFGPLAWRSLRFEWETAPVRDYQGTTVMNYADADVGFTRIHEFKHYHPERTGPYMLNKTVICREYPETYKPGMEAYYPVNDAENQDRYARYALEAAKKPRLLLGGRLGAYKYWDMDKAIANALDCFEQKIRPEAQANV